MLALLAARCGNIAAAEDALADALAAALTHWPARGIPENPQAWLYTTARHRLLDAARSAAERTRAEYDEEAIEAMFRADDTSEEIPDARLKLLFVCAHPAIDAAVRAPLMMQTVLGLEAAEIGRAFLVPETAMAQRLVRAKRKIKEAAIPFVLPTRSDMPARLEAVLEAIYGCFALGSEAAPRDSDGVAPRAITLAASSAEKRSRSDLEAPAADLAADVTNDPADNPADDLADEARFLANLLAHLLPDEPEVLGLAARISLAQARRAARHGPRGEYVPLEEQDTARWDPHLVDWGERLLQRAHACGRIGRFQLEAAIESVHLARARSGGTDWQALALLYEGLMRLAPSIGAAVGQAVALGHAQSPALGLAALERIERTVREAFQPAWAARAHLLAMSGRPELFSEAIQALDEAAARAPNEAVRDHLQCKRRALVDRGPANPSSV